MNIEFELSALRRTAPHEYLIRFALGGLITVLTGLISRYFGAAIGGVFLAIPAVFTASSTLIEKHERQKKQRAGIPFTVRGRQAAALDARGAALGSIGLLAFAFTAWKLLRRINTPLALLAALIAWSVVSGGLWTIHKKW